MFCKETSNYIGCFSMVLKHGIEAKCIGLGFFTIGQNTYMKISVSWLLNLVKQSEKDSKAD